MKVARTMLEDFEEKSSSASQGSPQGDSGGSKNIRCEMESFICKDDVVVIININLLKESVVLKNADILKMLFGIKEDSKFGSFSFERDENSHVLLLKNLDIESNDWYQFLSFVKNGFPPFYSQDVFKDSMKRSFFIENLENLNITCNKLGGIQFFDRFYNEFYNTLHEEMTECKNPSEPSEDINNIYIWGLGKAIDGSFSSSQNAYPTFSGWSITKYYKYEGDDFFWTRKKVKGSAEET